MASKSVKDAAATVETFAADAQKAFTEQFGKVTKGLEEAAAFGQQNVDALVKSSELAAKAAEGIGSEFSAWVKKSFDDSVAATKDFAGAKTVTELFEKQTAFAQTALEGFVAQATRLNDLYTAAAKDVTAPVAARFSAATSAVKSFAA